MKLLKKGIIKKLISMLITACLMITIANIPVYAGAKAISAVKTTDAVLSQKNYYTPKQVTKKTVKKSATANTSTAKKFSATKSKTSQIQIKNIANQSLKIINTLLNKKTISSLAKKWLKKAKTLINSIKNGKKTNTVKYKNLIKILASLKAIKKEKGSILPIIKQTVASGSALSSLKKVLKNNIKYKIYTKYGDEGINIIGIISKKYNLKEEDVYNAFVKSGTTKKEMKEYSVNLIILMGHGIDIFGWINPPKSIKKALEKIKNLVDKANENNNDTKTENINDNDGSNNDKNTTNENNTTEKPYQQNLNESNNIINNLLSNEDTSELAKSWLQAAQTKIDEVINGNGTDEQKQEFINKALKSLENIKNEKASVPVLIQEISSDSVFSSLSEFFEPDTLNQIYNEYGETGVNVISQLANKLSMLKDEVFNIFNKVIGVTKEQMEKAGSVILGLLKKGETFVNCASVAVGAYLNVDKNVAAVMNLASELAVSAATFVYYNENKNKFIGTQLYAEKNTLQKNGIDNVTQCYLSTFEDFMEGLQVGETTILNVNCYDLGGHAVTVKREENGYGVFDINTNYGKEIIYTPEDFKTLMTGERGTVVKGITSDGSQTCSREVYYTAIVSREIKEMVTEKNGYMTITRPVWNVYDVIDAVTNSNDIIKKARYTL